MGTLRTLEFIGIAAQIVGGIATTGIGVVKLRDWRTAGQQVPQIETDPDVELNVDLSNMDFNEVETETTTK